MRSEEGRKEKLGVVLERSSSKWCKNRIAERWAH